MEKIIVPTLEEIAKYTEHGIVSIGVAGVKEGRHMGRRFRIFRIYTG